MTGIEYSPPGGWSAISFETLPGSAFSEFAWQPETFACMLRKLSTPLALVRDGQRVGLAAFREPTSEAPANGKAYEVLLRLPPLPASGLGKRSFQRQYGSRAAYLAGAMANAISSEEMVIALGQAGLIGSFGAAGCSLKRVSAALDRIQAALPDGPYAVNLIHSPNEPMLERQLAEMFIQRGVRVVEASAYLDVTYALVWYRAAGLSLSTGGGIQIGNRIIAKVSRKEVARRFMQPAPLDLLDTLVTEGRITPEQALLAQKVPLADDVTAEADSGGHTDNRPLVGLLPTMLALRDELQAQYRYATPVRIGAAGGISTPGAALAAFMLGADYIVTGSVNQACTDSGASEHTRRLLAQADMADVMMAPSADMFEMGVKVQLLKKGTLFPLRAQKLYEIYKSYNSLDDIPTAEREKLEKQVFRRPLDDVWADTELFFQGRDPSQNERASSDPKHKMALVFRWYLGLSSRWSASGEPGRELDYQIWCGPSMGTFNDWARGTYLEPFENRRVVDVAMHILQGAAYLYRVQQLQLAGCTLDPALASYRPDTPLEVAGLAA